MWLVVVLVYDKYVFLKCNSSHSFDHLLLSACILSGKKKPGFVAFFFCFLEKSCILSGNKKNSKIPKTLNPNPDPHQDPRRDPAGLESPSPTKKKPLKGNGKRHNQEQERRCQGKAAHLAAANPDPRREHKSLRPQQRALISQTPQGSNRPGPRRELESLRPPQGSNHPGPRRELESLRPSQGSNRQAPPGRNHSKETESASSLPKPP